MLLGVVRLPARRCFLLRWGFVEMPHQGSSSARTRSSFQSSRPRWVSDLEVEAAFGEDGCEFEVPVPGALTFGGIECDGEPGVFGSEVLKGGVAVVAGGVGLEHRLVVAEDVELASKAVGLVGADKRFDDLEPLVPGWWCGAGVEGPEPEADPGVHHGSEPAECRVGVEDGAVGVVSAGGGAFRWLVRCRRRRWGGGVVVVWRRYEQSRASTILRQRRRVG